MSTEAEAAGELVNIALKGMEGVVTLTGKGAVSLAAFLMAALQDQKRTKGKVKLSAFREKSTSVFTLSKEELKQFHHAAKRYGILFSTIVDRKHLDGQCDILVANEDAGRVNRIIERFRLSAVKLDISGDEEKTEEPARKNVSAKTQPGTGEKPIQPKTVPKDEKADAELMEAFLSNGVPDEKDSPMEEANPTMAKKVQESPSVPSLPNKNSSADSLRENSKPSVRNALADAVAEAQRLNGQKREHLPPLSQAGPSLPDLGRKPISKAR